MIKDSLFRISFKCVILNEKNRVLVVKEHGRSSWDLPGGGIDHGESINDSIARELFEEVSYVGNFKYRVIKMTDPRKLATRDVWQIRIVLHLETDSLSFSAGSEADEITFIDPEELRQSDQELESIVFEYIQLVSK